MFQPRRSARLASLRARAAQALFELQVRIDEIIQERDALKASSRVQGVDPAATVPANGADLQSTLDNLQREREMLRSEVARQRAVADQSTVMATLMGHGESMTRESAAG